MKGLPFFWIVVAILLVPTIAASQPAPSDFAYGMPLFMAENGAVYQVSVPLEVYQSICRNDLADILIFNSANAAVPHVLRRPIEKSEGTETSGKLPFFPLYQKKVGKGVDGVSVRIEKGKDGAIINVDSGDDTTGTERKLSGYIIDAISQEDGIDALELIWQGDQDNFVTTVSLEYSNDLTHWSSLVARATLARMHFSGHEINRNRLLLPNYGAHYFRLSWPAGLDGVEVTGISSIRKGGKPEQKRLWAELSGGARGSSEEKKGVVAYEYDSSSMLPVDRLRLRFVEKNTLIRAAFFSRAKAEEKWRFRKSGVFYDLRFDQAALVQDSTAIGMTTDRYWRVEMDEGSLGDPEAVPVLELGWLPHDLVFVARGEGPFLLAYGSARLENENLQKGAAGLLAQVMGKDGDTLLKKAELLPKTILGGPDMLVSAPLPFPWRKWLLWGVLVAGVGIIARMALSLGKGMDNQQGS